MTVSSSSPVVGWAEQAKAREALKARFKRAIRSMASSGVVDPMASADHAVVREFLADYESIADRLEVAVKENAAMRERIQRVAQIKSDPNHGQLAVFPDLYVTAWRDTLAYVRAALEVSE